jgi:hypothetical protein
VEIREYNETQLPASLPVFVIVKGLCVLWGPFGRLVDTGVA